MIAVDLSDAAAVVATYATNHRRRIGFESGPRLATTGPNRPFRSR